MAIAHLVGTITERRGAKVCYVGRWIGHGIGMLFVFQSAVRCVWYYSFDLCFVLVSTCVHAHLFSDVNECLRNNGGCDSKRTCTNKEGGRTCGDCPSGWKNNGATGCKGLCWQVDKPLHRPVDFLVSLYHALDVNYC